MDDNELCECGDLPAGDCMCDEWDDGFAAEADAWVNEGRLPTFDWDKRV